VETAVAVKVGSPEVILDKGGVVVLHRPTDGILPLLHILYGFEHVFSRWITALARAGDVVILLSTSGNSPNIVRAAEASRAVGGVVNVALLGKDGGKLAGACDHQIIVPGATSDRIQELHMLLLHAWCEEIERQLGMS
ncbi:MAG: SIS domain-containing protein, partial [Phycisphaerales bacterium]|nr:SIS domain-containing protein [Phycisphaerales bacterium]